MAHMPPNESGADRLRRVVRVLNMCRESALDGFSPEQLINMVTACWKSDWDIVPSDLTNDERQYAADMRQLSTETLARLEETYG